MNNFQINSAVSLDRNQQQWINLGNRSEACLTQPQTCGAVGAAVSLWVKIFDCFSHGGILTTSKNSFNAGFTIFCHGHDQLT